MIIPLDNAEYPRLVFVYDLDDGYGVAPRGYRGDVTVELQQGVAFPIFFYEATAVREELDDSSKWGMGRFVAEPGLVLLPEISVANMKSSVLELIEIGYFAHLRPIAESAVSTALDPTGIKPTS